MLLKGGDYVAVILISLETGKRDELKWLDKFRLIKYVGKKKIVLGIWK